MAIGEIGLYIVVAQDFVDGAKQQEHVNAIIQHLLAEEETVKENQENQNCAETQDVEVQYFV